MLVFFIFSYAIIILLILLGQFIWFSLAGTVLFGSFVLIQLLKTRKFMYPTSLPTFFSCFGLLIGSLIIPPEALYPYTGSFFYAGFGLIFLISLIFKTPYSLLYFSKGGKVIRSKTILHYIVTSLWVFTFGISLYLSIALMPNTWYILAPILVVFFGFVFNNWLIPRLILYFESTRDLMENENISTVQKSMEGMIKYFKPHAVPGLKTVIQYEIEGENGGSWYVEIRNRQCSLYAGEYDNPDLKIHTEVSTWLSIAKGKISGEKAFMEGKLKAKGNTEILMQHEDIFDRKSHLNNRQKENAN